MRRIIPMKKEDHGGGRKKELDGGSLHGGGKSYAGS
jgi:hypothetical protein